MNYMIKVLVCAIKQCTTIYQTIGISHQASVTVGLLGMCITRTAFRELHVSATSQISPKLAITKDNKRALCNILYTRVGTLIVETIYLQLIQNRYMVRSFTVLQCSHQHCVQPVASDVEVVGYL